MRLNGIYFLIFLVHPGKSVRETEYCCTFCPGGERHTVCKYPKGGIGKDCVGFSNITLSDANRNSLLKMHNKLRQLVANGEIKQQPAGADLLEMIWDDELEFIAKRWNDQCIYEHDKCRNSLRFDVGQNMAFNYGRTAESMVQFWFDEYLITPKEFVDNMADIQVNVTLSGEIRERETGHYTQLVWANTYRVGCSVTVQYDAPLYKATIICDYGPSGNVRGFPMYKKGKGCSACPIGTECSKVYPGLCALRCSKLYPFFCSGSGRAIPFFGKFILSFLYYIL